MSDDAREVPGAVPEGSAPDLPPDDTAPEALEAGGTETSAEPPDEPLDDPASGEAQPESSDDTAAAADHAAADHGLADAPVPGPSPAVPTPAAVRVPAPAAPRVAMPSPAALAARRGPTGPRPTAYGRVDPDGTVYVRTTDGERSVGQVPDVAPAEALAFFVRRFEALQLEVELLEHRVATHALSPEDAHQSVRTVRSSVTDAHAVGDLDGLLARLNALDPAIAEQRSARKAERAQQSELSRAAKQALVTEAEKLAAGNDWRGGVNRFRRLLDEWKQLPRLDRSTDDALWHRFSSARTVYTRRRKTQFAQQAEHRESARQTKEKIIAEAETLAGSTDWGPTTVAYRELMTRWKAAGPAPRDVDDTLWQRFRGLQDDFFAAKNASQNEQDAEFRVNQQAKEALLVQAERLVPVTDLAAARTGYRELLDRWAEIGKVPRDAIRPLELRLKAIETAIRSSEDERWRRTNPEARARAEDTAGKLSAQIAEQEERARTAEAHGDSKGAAQARQAADTYRSWLEQANRAIDDFTV